MSEAEEVSGEQSPEEPQMQVTGTGTFAMPSLGALIGKQLAKQEEDQ